MSRSCVHNKIFVLYTIKNYVVELECTTDNITDDHFKNKATIP